MAQPETLGGRWLYAAKPGSWPKLLVPMLLGQAMGVAALGAVRVEAILVGVAFTVLDLLFIVFLNDYFDRRVDAVKREMFPDGCSPKTIPDGIYEVEVQVSDSPSNGSGRALTDELRSEPFVVDKTRPALGKVTIKNGRVSGSASDQGSWVHDVSFSVDGGSFEAASATDGIFDSNKESFEGKLPELDRGKHRLVVRVRDAHGNFVTRALVIDR